MKQMTAFQAFKLNLAIAGSLFAFLGALAPLHWVLKWINNTGAALYGLEPFVRDWFTLPVTVNALNQPEKLNLNQPEFVSAYLTACVGSGIVTFILWGVGLILILKHYHKTGGGLTALACLISLVWIFRYGFFA